MQENPVGVSIFTPVQVEGKTGVFNLQTAHMRLTPNGDCYVNKPTYQGYFRASSSKTEKPGEYKFAPVGDEDGRWQIIVPSYNNGNDGTLWVDTKSGSTHEMNLYTTNGTDDQKLHSYFYVYEVENLETDTRGEVKYVKDATVRLIGPSGNIVSLQHTGWSDFYEFIMYSGDATNGVNYGVSISNVLYHSATNQITANIKYAFPVSGNVARIPVHLCPTGNPDIRISIVDNTLKVVTKPDGGWVKDKNNQWYIYPKYENNDITYAIQNVGTGKYLSFTSTSRDITLGDTPCYFTLNGNAAGNRLKLQFKYGTYNYALYGNIVDYKKASVMRFSCRIVFGMKAVA